MDSGTGILGGGCTGFFQLPSETPAVPYFLCVLKKGSAVMCHISSLLLGDKPPGRLGSKSYWDRWSRCRGLQEVWRPTSTMVST